MLSEVITLAKDLETDSKGRIKTSVSNLRKVNHIKTKLYKIANNREYLAALKEFIGVFDKIYEHQLKIFGNRNNTDATTEKLRLTQQIARENTVAALSGYGIAQNVTNQLNDMLLRAVTNGEKFADLQQEFTRYLTAADGGSGALSRYAKTYSVTAISRYTGQNNKLFTDDLGLEWYQYVGSEIETTRPWCNAMIQKEFAHRSEFERLLSGAVDVVKEDGSVDTIEVPIYEKTGLPQGMFDGTTADSLQCNCGGWNCRHQLVPVAATVVPKYIRERLANPQQPQDDESDGYKKWWSYFPDFAERWAADAKRAGISLDALYNKEASFEDLEKKAGAIVKAVTIIKTSWINNHSKLTDLVAVAAAKGKIDVMDEIVEQANALQWGNIVDSEDKARKIIVLTEAIRKYKELLETATDDNRVAFERIQKNFRYPMYKYSSLMLPQDASAYRDSRVIETKKGQLVIIPTDLDTTKQHVSLKQILDGLDKLPDVLAEHIKEIRLCDFRNAADSYWARKYKMKNFRSFATDGEKITFYENEAEYGENGYSADYIPHTLLHESAHSLDFANGTISNSPEWHTAVAKEAKMSGSHKFITSYGRSSGSYKEDFADSVAMCIEVGAEKFTAEHPYRAAIFKKYGVIP